MDILSAAVHSPDFQSKLAALLLTALAGWFLQRLWPAERVVWGTSHGFSFSIPQKDAALSLLHTRSFYIRNTGRESATGLEVHFSFKPEHFQIWPTFNYITDVNPEGHFTIQVENIGKKEWLSIEW